ncbi:MAG: cytochrome C [Rhodospirillales bacterium CG15_BIG_FIL_POST_REV_8_21_14_020_66_15]|nr:MAG: cytochrome C [Rhodospirillales bacterium CG15_BIG_FIL_POST_REV_8_21_14_020_66_15]
MLGGAAWLWWAAENADATIRLTPDDAQTVAAGEAVYKEYCAQCHGPNLKGQADWRERLPSGRLPAPPHDRTGHTWHHPDAQLFDLTKRGPAAVVGGDYESDMPAYAGTLTDDEIVAVLSYIKSTWPPAVRRRHDDINQRADQRSMQR